MAKHVGVDHNVGAYGEDECVFEVLVLVVYVWCVMWCVTQAIVA